MEIVNEELHFYQAGTSEYRLNKIDYCEYQILFVRGFKALDSGSAHYVFVNGTDYEQRGDKIYWLGNDLPAVPPSVLGYERIPFWITYVYEKRPESTIRSSIYPFISGDSTLTSVMTAIGTQVYRSYQKRGRIVKKRHLASSLGAELDMLADWYNTSRYDGESDLSLRSRLQEFLSTFLSSGTPSSIISLMERITGKTPTIEEFWQQTSYYDYNPDDTTQEYVYDDGASDNIARYYSFINQPAVFYVIFDSSDYDVFPTYGPYKLKKSLNLSKAEGTIGYLGYLVDESFGSNDDNWERQTHVPSGTGDDADWSVSGGEYVYSDTSSTYHDGLSVVDNSDFDDAWGDYQITGYARDSTGTADQLAGIVTRWQASGTDQYDFYIFGISAYDDKAYCYYWDDSGGTFYERGTTGGASVSGGIDTSSDYHLRVDIRGTSARFYVDNELVISDVDDFSDLKHGRPGVACIDQSVTHATQTAYFDEIQVVV